MQGISFVFVCSFLSSIVGCEDITCPINEHFNSCGTACPKNCQNWDQDIICTMQCVPGCVCDDGLVREYEGGPCIDPLICEKCDENEQFSTCTTLCPPTCANTTEFACPLVCVQGCECQKGYIRKKRGGKCILEDLCPQKCEDNEEYVECGTLCPETCALRDRPCPKICSPGCFCKNGYLLDDYSGECIDKDDC